MGDIEPVCDLARDDLQGLVGLPLRVACNKLRKVLDTLDPPPLGPWKDSQRDSIIRMSPEEIEEFGNTEMRFGQFKGEQIKYIEKSYLAWVADTQRETSKQMTRYLKSLPQGDNDGSE